MTEEGPTNNSTPVEADALGAVIPLFERIAATLCDVATHVNRQRRMFPDDKRDLRTNIGKQFGEHGRLTMRNTPQNPPRGVAAGVFWRGPDPAPRWAVLDDHGLRLGGGAVVGIEVTHENRDPHGVRTAAIHSQSPVS